MASGYQKMGAPSRTVAPSAKAKGFLFIVLLLSTTLCTASCHKSRKKSVFPRQIGPKRCGQAIQTACNYTSYPQVCIDSLCSYPGALSAQPRELTVISMEVALVDVNATYFNALKLTKVQGDPMELAALNDCVELFDDSRDQLLSSITRLSNLDVQSFHAGMMDVQTWVSAALTDQTTCSDGFDGLDGVITASMLKAGDGVSQLLSNSLALLSTLSHLGINASKWQASESATTQAPPSSPTCS